MQRDARFGGALLGVAGVMQGSRSTGAVARWTMRGRWIWIRGGRRVVCRYARFLGPAYRVFKQSGYCAGGGESAFSSSTQS